MKLYCRPSVQAQHWSKSRKRFSGVATASGLYITFMAINYVCVNSVL